MRSSLYTGGCENR